MSVVLTVDLDFFVSPTATWRNGRDRLDDNEYEVWSEPEVRDFLQRRCNLSTTDKIRGAMVAHHDQAFDLIKGLHEDHTLTFPIHLINVDAHSDLGLGDAGWVHILTEVIHRSVADRAVNLRKDRRADGLNEANWIAYTIANRWLRRLTLVKQSNDHQDLFPYYFKERNNRTQMQMYPFTMDDYARVGMQRDDEYRRFFEEKTTEEPPVDLTLLGAADLSLTASPDYLIFCHSPGFTPPKADGLLGVFNEYIRQST